MKSERPSRPARGALVWALRVIVPVVLAAVGLLFFYGDLIGGKMGDERESVFRSILPAGLWPSVSAQDASDRSSVVPTRIQRVDPRNRIEALANIRPDVSDRQYDRAVLAAGLTSPDGVAVHPTRQTIFVAQEDSHTIGYLDGDAFRAVIDLETPIYEGQDGDRVQAEPLRFPEGIAFSGAGDLYAVEDVPGGRLLRFQEDETGGYSSGTVVPVPGQWNTFAWEGVDVGPNGTLLMAGSDLEYVTSQNAMGVFTGAIVYRDEQGDWWIPHRRFFSSLSAVAFSKSGRQAVYTCEVTGEVGWLDLNSPYTLGGHSRLAARSPEGVTVLRDGTLLIAEEAGSIVHLDPASDRYARIVTDLETIESVWWDDVAERILVTEDGTGQVWAFSPDTPYDVYSDMLIYAKYHPAFSKQNIPERCPPYLARILERGGLSWDSAGAAPVSFRQFLARVPLVAADVRAVSMNTNRDIEDPVERVQFVIFEPNRMMRPSSDGPGTAFALFAVRKVSGELVTTSALPVVMASATGTEESLTQHGTGPLAVPLPGAVSVSGIGVAAVQFMGMGRTPDFSLVLNPRNPADSYMVVFHKDGSRDHYRLDNAGEQVRDHWVIAYRQLAQDQWTRLSPDSTPGYDRDALMMDVSSLRPSRRSR